MFVKSQQITMDLLSDLEVNNMTIVNGYEQSDREEHIHVLNLESLEARAEKLFLKAASVI